MGAWELALWATGSETPVPLQCKEGPESPDLATAGCHCIWDGKQSSVPQTPSPKTAEWSWLVSIWDSPCGAVLSFQSVGLFMKVKGKITALGASSFPPCGRARGGRLLAGQLSEFSKS